MKYSTILNRNFLVKVDRTLVGFAGLVRSVGERNACRLLDEAMTSLSDVYRPKTKTRGHRIYFYSV